jgi:hypothetical protein
VTQAGCVTVLRATYADSTGVLAATMGIAVMRCSAVAAQAAVIIDTIGSAWSIPTAR